VGIRIAAAALAAAGQAMAQMPADVAAKLREGLCRRDGGACPRTSDLKGHNHISEIAHLGSADDVAFGLELLEFIKTAK
jgi:hypothetical protein